jgi:hypothetical protein
VNGAQRWSGLRNGVLLRAAVDAGFDVFITNDSSIEFQQNVKRIGIAVIAIVAVRNRMEDLEPLLPRILEALIASTGPADHNIAVGIHSLLGGDGPANRAARVRNR